MKIFIYFLKNNVYFEFNVNIIWIIKKKTFPFDGSLNLFAPKYSNFRIQHP